MMAFLYSIIDKDIPNHNEMLAELESIYLPFKGSYGVKKHQDFVDDKLVWVNLAQLPNPEIAKKLSLI